MASKQKSIQKPRAVSPAPATPKPSELARSSATPAPAAVASPPGAAPAEVLAPMNTEAAALAGIIDRIATAIDSLGAQPNPSDARRVALQIDSEIMRASLRLVGLRTKASALAQHAHVAELAAMAGEVAR